jgi:hypothetical protein
MQLPESSPGVLAPESGFQPSAFLAYCVPRRGDAATVDDGRRFATAFGRAHAETLRSEGWTVHLAVEGSADVGTEPGGRVSVLLHGELYAPSPRTAEALAAAYVERGDALFRDLNGSFTLLLLDHRTSRLTVVPDRVRSHRVFHSWDGVGHRLTSRLTEHPTRELDFDPVGVAWILSSGSCFGPRTIFDGVQIFERAHAHELTPGGIRSTEYWSHAVRDPEDAPDPDRQAAEFEEIMVEAVRRRLEGAGDVFLSLSAGHDSKGIAAVLARRLHVRGVRSFSYTRRPLRPGTDAFVAEQIARRLGFEHWIVESYRGDYLEHLRQNARLGQGMVKCHGVDAWLELKDTFLAADAPVLLTGEEYLGMHAFDLPDLATLRARMRFRELLFPARLDRYLPSDLLREMRRGLDEDAWAIIDGQPPADSLWQAYAYCAFDQRCGNVVLPWRETFPARWTRVRNPWLDRDVLDYGATVGWAERRDKRLFRRALARMDAELEAMPREREEGYRADYREEAVSHAAELRDWMASTESRLDDLIPVEFGHALVEAGTRPPARPSLARRATRALRRRLPGGPPPLVQPAAKYLRRYVALRMAHPRT